MRASNKETTSMQEKNQIGDLPIWFLSKEVHRFSPYPLSHTSSIPSLRMTESIVCITGAYLRSCFKTGFMM